MAAMDDILGQGHEAPIVGIGSLRSLVLGGSTIRFLGDFYGVF